VGFPGCAIECCQSHFPSTDPCCHGNEICDKIGYNSACVKAFGEILRLHGGFRRWAIEYCQSHFSPTDPRCDDNEIRDKIGYKSACVRDICEIFCICGEFSEMGHQMLPTKFYPDRPSPCQQNLRPNGLYISLYNKYHQDPCISRRCGLRVWQFDDVSWSLPRPTLISWYNEQQRSRSSSSSRHTQPCVPNWRYTALP